MLLVACAQACNTGISMPIPAESDITTHHYHKKAELMGSLWEAHENSVPVVKVPANAGEYVHATWIQMSRKETRGHPNGLYSIVGHHLHGIICYGLVWPRLMGRATLINCWSCLVYGRANNRTRVKICHGCHGYKSLKRRSIKFR